MSFCMTKNPTVTYTDSGDEFDWYDFKYALGMLLARKFDEYVKVEARVTSPISHVTRMGRGCFRLNFARNCEEYGRDFLLQMFPREIGSLQIYSLTNRKGLAIRHTHHDNPVNGDWFYVTPCAEKTYRRAQGC